MFFSIGLPGIFLFLLFGASVTVLIGTPIYLALRLANAAQRSDN